MCNELSFAQSRDTKDRFWRKTIETNFRYTIQRTQFYQVLDLPSTQLWTWSSLRALFVTIQVGGSHNNIFDDNDANLNDEIDNY